MTKPVSNDTLRTWISYDTRVDRICDYAFKLGVEDEAVLDLLVDAKEALLPYLAAMRKLDAYLEDRNGEE